MIETFTSPIFGYTRHATDQEREVIANTVAQTPVAVFQALNQLLNSRGMSILITASNKIPDVPHKTENA